MLLNSIGDTVTRLLNLAVKQCDGSWLTQLLLMLRSHRPVLRTLCAVVCHLVTRQASTLSDCHVHALVAILVHWCNFADTSAGIKVQRDTEDGPESKFTRTTPFVSYVLESLPLSTTANMSFSLLFTVSYIIYTELISHDLSTDDNQVLSHEGLVILQSADERIIVPPRIIQLLSYLGPRLVKDLRHSSSRGCRESAVSYEFASVVRFLSHDLVRISLDQSRMSFESWVRSEMEVVDDDGLTREWLSEYYNWVVFSRWHEPQSVTDSTTRTYLISVLQALAHAVLDFDMRCSQPHSRCCHNTTQQCTRHNQNGRHNVISFLQASSANRCCHYLSCQ